VTTPILSQELTYAQLVGIYQDYSDYDLVESVARGRVFVQAGRMILARPIRRSAQAGRGEEVELAPEIMEKQIETAVAWLATRRAANLEPLAQLGVDPCWREL